MKAKRLVIHIGMHKTGSSTIQRFLSLNRRALGLMGVAYPLSRGPDGRRQPKHAALFAAISHEADFGVPHPDLGPAAALVDDLSRRIERARAPVAVLSAEGFSGERPIFAQALAPLRSRFDATVVVFIRRRDLWVESFYKQMVMSRAVREAREFQDFLDAPETRAHMDYAAILSWWEEAFGGSALRALPFAPAPGAPHPVAAFLGAADLPPNLARLPFARGHENPSPSAAATALVRLANERGIQISPAGLRRAASLLPENSDSFLSENNLKAISTAYETGDRELATAFPRLKKVLPLAQFVHTGEIVCNHPFQLKDELTTAQISTLLEKII